MRVASLLLIFFSNVCLAGSNADQIMERVDKRYDGDSMISVQTLLLANAKGQKKIRQIKSFSKDEGLDRKSILFLLKPADVRNIAFLSYRWRSVEKNDDNWLYLPALDRVDRLPLSDRSNAFMGSDFSYADMDGYRLTEWDYRLVKESVQVDNQDCYLIEATPKAKYAEKVFEETGYARVEHWVRKDLFIVVQSKMYVADSSKMKWLTVEDISQVDSVWTPHKLTMRSYKGKRLEHASILQLSEVQYNQPLNETLFTTGRLRQGP